MFNENSGLVKLWVRHIKSEDETLAYVPNISNLRAIVEPLI